MASKKSAKKQAKLEKQERREAARRAERRRNLLSLAVVLGVIVLGGALIGITVAQDRAAEQAAAEELEALQSEAASEAARIANRDVACGAEVPPDARTTAARPAASPTAPATEPTAMPSPEDVLDEGVDYAAVIETSCGTIRVDLAEDEAPETVNAFVSLARDGFYDGLEIFRNATTIGALQTGSGNNTASFDIGYTLPDELDLAEEQGYPPGSVAMANAGPGTAGSQFFFVYNELFDEQFADSRTYTRFGMVTDGMDVLEEIGAIEAIGPQGETPAELVYMESVEIEEN